MRTLQIGGREFIWGARTYLMGVLNVTPDSFSGDGTFRGSGAISEAGVQAAVEQALRFEDEGADIIDVGGESTRPPAFYKDARPVTAEDELARVLPVIAGLEDRLSAPISIDSRKAAVVEAAVREGAAMANDVSMLGDPDMAGVVAKCRVPFVISHIRPKAEYVDVVTDVAADLRRAVDKAVASGVSRDRIIADPGIGFGKRAEHSLEVLRRLPELKGALGLPLLVGTSRKSFIGAVLDLPVEDRVEGTAATVALSIAGGANIVRVHDVRQMARVARMTDAIVRGWAPVPKSTASGARSS